MTVGCGAKGEEIVTGRMNNIIGDLPIICECVRQLDNCHPRALTLDNKPWDKEKEIERF